MTWVNRGMYWAWLEHRKRNQDGGYDEPMSPRPTKKTLEYVTVCFEGQRVITADLCIGVYDDDKYTPLHRDEMAFWLQYGEQVGEPHTKTFQ